MSFHVTKTFIQKSIQKNVNVNSYLPIFHSTPIPVILSRDLSSHLTREIVKHERNAVKFIPRVFYSSLLNRNKSQASFPTNENNKVISGQTRSIFQEKKRLPKLIFVPNLFSWMKHKVKFWMLKQWDPEFTEGQFRFGTMTAISKVTNLISQDRYEDLAGLLTKNARFLLLHDVETRWTDIQKRLIGLEPEHIQLIIPRRLNFGTVFGKRMCEVDLVFIALKWAEYRSRRVMILVEAFARFKRDFSVGVIPEWTITLFKVNRFEIIPR